MAIACKHVVDTEEFVTLNESLVSILVAVDHRVQSLEGRVLTLFNLPYQLK